MSNSELSEIYFVAGAMILTLIISAVAFFIFLRQYRREMRNKEEAKRKKSQTIED